MDLCDLLPVDYNYDTYKGGSINVQKLDAYGMVVPKSNFFWYDDEDGTAWFDGEDEEVSRGDVPFAPGDAFWVKANNTTEKIQTSGQVAQGSIDVVLRTGFKLVCNATPVAIPLNDDNKDGRFLMPSGYDYDTYKGGSINFQKLDEYGMVVPKSNYFWYDDEDGTAWFDGEDEEAKGVTLQPGESIWVKANNSDEVLTIPGVTLK